MFDIPAFRSSYPEFTDTVKYPNSMISGWAVIAEAQVVPCRWKNQTQLGINLYVAHEITLQAQSVAAGKIGGTPGAQSGPASSKTVGSVTIAYDTQQVAEKNAGWWNLTVYGKQFWRLAMMYGAGAMLV